jgi:DNA-binding response OmpR family regulator
MSRILIIEDDPAILCGLRDNLIFESHQVFTATDGEAGYRSLRENSPELVILDTWEIKMNIPDRRKLRLPSPTQPIFLAPS